MFRVDEVAVGEPAMSGMRGSIPKIGKIVQWSRKGSVGGLSGTNRGRIFKLLVEVAFLQRHNQS